MTTSPATPYPPTAEEDAAAARRYMNMSVEALAAEFDPLTPPYLRDRIVAEAHTRALLGIGRALLAVAGEVASIREQGIYRAGDGA